MKIRSMEAEMFRPDERTDMTKLMVTLCNFVKEPKTVR